ncbi:GNAT family N-acetyltransferase [Deinococcus peraridilitoris]|uniref:Acetyltransferase, ribosomal protein N-acetylase n=1 Tax=Deinococcus peraridilitoris (strain DSM 19664 / LMG 22246 / CIP 109416 / KR-200) TaxID=937777 RepID=L0A1G9_DEIPD|nr:GNAT family protein [Deinococcus peraridilitoris]AFZ67743.1 acetyltransferase, ribosomal protein N-acetylase [Deinococcus peraridilitoris DSM 19664]
MTPNTVIPNTVTLDELTLQGQLVRLEPLREVHVPGLLQAASAERETFRWTTVPDSFEAMTRYVERALADAAAGRALPFATCSASGEVLGATRFGNIEHWIWPDGRERSQFPDAVEIGWTWLAQRAQRSGVNTEAKLLMLTHAFESWGVKRVTIKTDARNERSRAAIERLGARFEGVLRAHSPAADGGVRDTAMYSVIRPEWPEVRQNLQARLAP